MDGLDGRLKGGHDEVGEVTQLVDNTISQRFRFNPVCTRRPLRLAR
jgi:hypothetical protein